MKLNSQLTIVFNVKLYFNIQIS